MLAKNIGSKPWRWPFTDDGIADVVQPGEVYEIVFPPVPRLMKDEAPAAYERRLAAFNRTVRPQLDLVETLQDANVLFNVTPLPALH
jgi:hypothetical protein